MTHNEKEKQNAKKNCVAIQADIGKENYNKKAYKLFEQIIYTKTNFGNFMDLKVLRIVDNILVVIVLHYHIEDLQEDLQDPVPL